MITDIIKTGIEESISVKSKLLSGKFISDIEVIAESIINAYKNGNKILICGNGGSASDAQHFEGELVGRFKMERKALPAIALTANSSTVTAVANDYGYEDVFRRGVEAFGNNGDILIAISASGNSVNVIKATEQAHKQGCKVIALTGKTGGELAKLADISITVPSGDCARIQECHIMIIHIVCELVERGLFSE
jgi:D-sedoheptulose 7-phosphate isomerase